MLPAESKSRPAPPTWPGPLSTGPPGKPEGEPWPGTGGLAVEVVPPILALGTRRITRSEPSTTAVPAALSVKRLTWLYPTTCCGGDVRPVGQLSFGPGRGEWYTNTLRLLGSLRS